MQEPELNCRFAFWTVIIIGAVGLCAIIIVKLFRMSTALIVIGLIVLELWVASAILKDK